MHLEKFVFTITSRKLHRFIKNQKTSRERWRRKNTEL